MPSRTTWIRSGPRQAPTAAPSCWSSSRARAACGRWTRDFVRAVAAFCRERDLLLLVDEVQTGVGRTGSLFAFQQYGILPDVCSFAKGIAGGLPMSGIMANGKCRTVLTPGTHATTFGGNPVCAAAALRRSRRFWTPTRCWNQVTRRRGPISASRIEAMGCPRRAPAPGGMGLMIGVTLKEGIRQLRDWPPNWCEAGLLVLTAGQNVLRLLPPLTITARRSWIRGWRSCGACCAACKSERREGKFPMQDLLKMLDLSREDIYRRPGPGGPAEI